MAFNYYNNHSIIGKARSIGGLKNLNFLNAGITYVSHTIDGNAVFSANNVLGTSTVIISGNQANNIDYRISIVYNVTNATTLNWTTSVSSEGSSDFGYLSLNGLTYFTGSGEESGTGNTLMIIGQNTLVLAYIKDGNTSVGSDSFTANWSFT